MNPRLQDVLSRLKGVKPCGNGHKAHCPAHEDRRQSLHVSEGEGGRVLIYCHAGCSVNDVCAAIGLEVKDLSPKTKRARSGPREVITTYDYRDAAGQLLYQVVRYFPKDFRQRRPDGKGGWVWNMRGVQPVPYRLPELLEAFKRGEIVFVVEGEKDADNLACIGLTATCNHGGAGKWREFHAKYFLAGAEVVVLPDNDEAGRKHAQDVARSLATRGCRVKVLELPGLPPKGDVSDWLDTGGTGEKLLELVEQAPEWELKPAAKPGPAREYLTDLGNAQRLVARHGRDLRFCHPWGKWLVWDGKRWKVDDTGEVLRRAKETVRAFYAEAAGIDDDRERRDFLKFALRSENKDRLAAMVTLAASEPGIPVLPEELDRDPWLLNVENGTIDLRTGELLPHRREDFLTKITPVVYDPQASCPTWEKFLDRIMAGNQNLITFLQRAAGYSLTGDTSEQCLFLLYGTGANGKTVFLTTLQAVLGDYSTQAAPDLLLAKKGDRHPTELADLAGMRLVVATETDAGRRLAESLVKQLTGGDRVKARRMRENYWEFETTHKLFLATNHKPRVRGTDNSIWRRIRLIPFTVTIPPEEQDKNLPAKLRRELPGILAWAVRGCLAWQRQGLDVPDEVIAATENYRAEQDVLAAFLEECCIINTSARVVIADLYKAYLTWCEKNGENPMSQRELGGYLSERGFYRDRGAKGTWFWYGIGLLEKYGGDVGDVGDVNSTLSYIRKNEICLYEKQDHLTSLTSPEDGFENVGNSSNNKAFRGKTAGGAVVDNIDWGEI